MPSSKIDATFPFINNSPEVLKHTPANILSNVDLPDPLVPIIPNISPSLTSNEILFKAINSFWVFLLNGFLLYVDISEKSRKTGYSVKEFPYISIFETEKIENFLYDE